LSNKPQIALNYTKEQVQNFLSVTHNVVCLLMILCYVGTLWSEIIPLMCIWSQSYYLFDSFNYHGKKDKTIMICHHVGSVLSELFLFILCYHPYDVNGRAVLWGFFYCELSNYPMYYIEHYKHRIPGELNYVDPSLYFIEGLSFLILRGIVGFYYLFLNPVTIKLLWGMICGFWFMSLYWGGLMVRKFLIQMEIF
jgi:hypothetical protein